MGVRRAIEMVLAEANRGKGPICTFGPLIHNNQVLKLLESKGIGVLEKLEEDVHGTVVIRAHGIPPQQRKYLRASDATILDATCPRVARVQSIIRYHTNKGYTAVIAGDVDHQEVVGLVGYSTGPAHVISSVSEIDHLPDEDKIFLVAQTTQDDEVYHEIKEAFKSRYPNGLVFNTICDATHKRQEEVRSFSGQVDGVVVVGGYHSGNTQRLVQVSRAAGLSTYHVETEGELDTAKLSSMDSVGVTAGASTPNWMIREVVQKIGAIRGRGESFYGRWVRGVVKFFLLSNLGVAAGAFCLAHAAAILLDRETDWAYPSLGFLYIYAMHLLNRFLDKDASTYNDPEMANFYKRYRGFLILSGLASMVGAFAVSFYLGTVILLATAGLSLLGILYSIPLVPANLQRRWRYAKIKDFPGSKTLSVALAWGAVLIVLPLFGAVPTDPAKAIIPFLIVFSMVYIRSAIFDIFQAQGDLIVGVETLPIVIGEKRTILLLKSIILLIALMIFFTPPFGLITFFALLMLIPFLQLSLCLLAYERRWLYPGTRLEALVEVTFILTGLLALIWRLGI
jgi:4-hydroxy-3-methylbut-2-enyl diphosphate reductase